MKKFLILLLLSTGLHAQYPLYGPALNKDGSFVTGILTASFDPFGQFSGEAIAPFPTSLLMGSDDLTIDIPVADPNNPLDPQVALNSMDGFSTTEKWVTTFANGAPGNFDNAIPGEIDPTSVVPGQSVRVFKVATQQFLFVTGVEKELIPGVDFTAVVQGNTLAIIPLQPLEQYADYMAVLTNDINDMAGNDATPDRMYNFGKFATPWVDGSGQSTNGLFSDAAAAQLEQVREIVGTMEGAAEAMGIPRKDVILSWTVHTQSVQAVLGAVRQIAQPGDTTIIDSTMTTAAIGGPGIADIHIGIIDLPYFSGIPSAENPAAQLSGHWKASPGAYLPPYDQIGLDPNSTNLTAVNPFPVPTGVQTVPVLVTVPNAGSGMSQPDAGWPVVLYLHGMTRSRADALGVADTLAAAGYAVVSMDLPLHGIVPELDPAFAPLYVGNTPFAGAANERTFDGDLWNNDTGAPGPDGKMDRSGMSAVNLANLQVMRDNIRQGIADFSVLALSLQNMKIVGDDGPYLNGFDVSVVGQSMGGFGAVPFAALEPLVSRMYLNVTAGGIMRTMNGGSFGPGFIQPFLSALAGIEVGTPEFERYMVAAQTLVDSNDPINWAGWASQAVPIVHNMVIGDDTVPNAVAGAPMAGSDGINRLLGLTQFDSTQLNPEGLSAVSKFVPPAIHSSLLSPLASPQASAEMHGQMASFIGSGGTAVVVTNPTVLEAVAVPAAKARKDKHIPPRAVAPIKGKPSRDQLFDSRERG